MSTAVTEADREGHHRLAGQLRRDAEQITRDAELEELDIDSLDLAELSQIIEEQFGVELTGSDVAEIRTVGDAIT